MRNILLLVTAMLAGVVSASAQNEYSHKEFTSSEGQTLNYRELTPQQVEAKEKYPLVIFLHGAGERGDDNEKHLIHGSQMFLNPVNREKYPAYVLFPQCPSDRYWSLNKRPESFSDITREERITPILQAVKELILQYSSMPSIDPSRIYILGLSMGGMATYDLVSRHPELFAAAIPICGAVTPGHIAAAKDVKFRIYHGDADDVVPVECSRRAYKELVEASADVEYLEFPGCKHVSWNLAFSQPDFMSWLFAQKKGDRAKRKNR